MTEPGDKRLFDGLLLEEPSESVDRQVLRMAREELIRRARRETRAIVFFRGALLTAAVLVAALLWLSGRYPFHHRVQPRNPSVTHVATPETAVSNSRADAPVIGAGPSARGDDPLFLAVQRIRLELLQIDEMSQLIAPERRTEREEIRNRVEDSLKRLQRIEQRL